MSQRIAKGMKRPFPDGQAEGLKSGAESASFSKVPHSTQAKGNVEAKRCNGQKALSCAAPCPKTPAVFEP